MRLFYALWPDEPTRSALLRWQHPLQGRKTRADNLHITLAFLGEQPESALPILQAIVNTLSIPDMNLVISRLGYFKRQRIAWAGMQETPDELLVLHRELAEELQRHDIAYDQRNDFKPHVTLARDAEAPGDPPMEPIVWRANHVGLMQSVMKPGGVHYQLIASRFFNPGS